MLVESVASSLAVGKVRGGKFKNIGELNIKKQYLFIIGFAIEFISVFLYSQDLGQLSTFLDQHFIWIHSLSYLLIFIGLIYNFNRKSMVIIFVGALLNYIVIVANHGQMPVSGEGLTYLNLENYRLMLEEKSVITHTLLTENTRLKWLADVIRTPKLYPLPKMISIGDVFLGIGVFMIIQRGMLKEVNKKEDVKRIKDS